MQYAAAIKFESVTFSKSKLIQNVQPLGLMQAINCLVELRMDLSMGQVTSCY